MVEQIGISPAPATAMERFAHNAMERLLPHAQQLATRRSMWGLDGMIQAMVIRDRDALAGISPVDSFVAQAVRVLSPHARIYPGQSRRTVLEKTATNIAQLRQAWEALATSDTLSSVAIQQKMEGLATEPPRPLTQQDAQVVHRRFTVLTASQSAK